MKFFLALLLIAYSCYCQQNSILSKADPIQTMNELKNLSKHYKTWIRSLLGITTKTGLEINACNVIFNLKGGGEIQAIFKNKNAITNPLKNQLKTKSSTPEILLTARSNVKGDDKCFALNNVSIQKIQVMIPIKLTKPVKYDSVEVSFSFQSCSEVECAMQITPQMHWL